MTAEPSAEVRRTAMAGPLDRLMVELGQWTVGALAALLVISALVICWRRLAAALDAPLEPSVLVSVGVLLAGVAVGIRVAWRRVPPQSRSRRLDRLIVLLPTVAVLSVGAALSLPHTHAVALAFFWIVLVAGECWAWRPATWRRMRRTAEASSAAGPVRVDPPQAPSPHPPPAESVPDQPPAVATASVPAEDVLQQLTRSQAADGSEELAGWLRMPFTPGQRTTSVHVAFCPPFARTPELVVRQLDGPSARIKTAQLLPHGARLDLKLTAAVEAFENVLLEFSARAKGQVTSDS